MHKLKNRFPLLLAAGLLLTGMLVNSCKKTDDSSSLTDYLTSKGAWELAAVYRYNYTGDAQTIDTLNKQCTLSQTFIFNADGTCTYNNYSCLTNQANGKWAFSQDRLMLTSDIVCKDDTSAAKQSQPFARVVIVNLGRNSLVLQRNDTISIIRNVVRRRVTQYGFIHTAR